jgi:hypothetical protein
MLCPDIEQDLENLGTGYERFPISAETGGPPQGYNCIAFAAGRTDQWWWPSHYKFLYYWPPHLLREAENCETPENFIRAFEWLGYKQCKNGKCVRGIEKVAIFLKNKVPKHAARQLESGLWISKCGGLHDIHHETLEEVQGLLYGTAAIFMHRRRDGKAFLKDRLLAFWRRLPF